MMVSNDNVSPRRRPDIPARFESLNDDTLTTIAEFVGKKSYKSFGVNKRCREVYLSSGMTKKTFLYGYGPLSAIIDRIPRSGRFNQNWYKRVGKGVVLYNRRDVLDWALDERNEEVIKGICNVAGKEGRTDILEEVWSNVNDRDDKRSIFGVVDLSAARGGKLNVLKWVEDKGLPINKFVCAMKASRGGQLHIIQWLRDERGLELGGYLYVEANYGGNHLHVMKWLREQEVDWDEDTFYHAAEKGNLNILQWLHDEGCPWPEDYLVYEYRLKPEALDWCRVNGYGNRIILRR